MTILELLVISFAALEGFRVTERRNLPLQYIPRCSCEACRGLGERGHLKPWEVRGRKNLELDIVAL